MIAITLLLTCLAMPLPHSASPKAFDFRPELFFFGATHGQGILKVRGKAPRRFTVQSRGRMEANNLFRLDQTVTFADGAVETRTWYLRPLDGSRYSASLSDARGSVSAETKGNLFHLRYLIRKPSVYMEQWLYLQSDGRTVLNIGKVRIFGIQLAELSETIACTL